MACDLCGKTGTTLVDLRPQYQTSDIKNICPDCEREVNKHHFKLVGLSHKISCGWLKKFMFQRQRKMQPGAVNQRLIDALQMAKHIVEANGTQAQLDQVFEALEAAGVEP